MVVATIDDLARVMVLMQTHKIDVLEMEGLKLVKTFFEAPVIASRDDPEDDDDMDEDMLYAHVRR